MVANRIPDIFSRPCEGREERGEGKGGGEGRGEMGIGGGK